MRRLVVIIVVMMMSAVADAGTYCDSSSDGTRIYCNGPEGRKNFYVNPKTGYIYSPQGSQYHQYGSTLYGNDGSWRRKSGTTRLTKPPTTSDAVVDELFRGGGSIFDD